MNKHNCTIYDCEMACFYDGIIIDNVVYALDNTGKSAPAREYVCEYVDFDMVQFYIGQYDKKEPLCSNNKNTSKWGFFKLSTGEIVVPPIYDYAYPFYGDRACVKKNGRFGFVDPEGNEVVDLIWDETDRSFHGALCWVKKGNKFGYIDKNGLVVLRPQFQVATILQYIGNDQSDYEYAALVKQGGRHGYINEKGSYIFEPGFEDAREFWGIGYAPVMIYGKWGFIDRKGNFAVGFELDEVGEPGGLRVNINSKDKDIFREKYIYFYTIKKYGMWGIMDSELNIILPEDNSSYVEYIDRKIYIKDGKVTNRREIRPKKDSEV